MLPLGTTGVGVGTGGGGGGWLCLQAVEKTDPKANRIKNKRTDFL
jgi:hypothetical protein